MRNVKSTNNWSHTSRLLRARLFASLLRPHASSLKPQAQRRGVLLLVCLSLLVLFAVLAITFVMVAGQYRRGSKAESAHERYGDNYRKQLDDAFGQLIRDTTNNASSVAGHALLTDMYGTQTLTGTVDPTSVSQLPTNPGQIIAFKLVPESGTLSIFDGFYNGQVLTILNEMVDGPSSQSARIVGYNGATGMVRVLAFERGGHPNDNSSRPPSRFVINGRPFNGTGFGYNATSGKLDAAASPSGPPFALLPHKRYTLEDEKAFAAAHSNVSPSAFPNEDYDAPDPQNMALGYLTPNATSSSQIMPSFHRPDLVNYWMYQANSSATSAADWTSIPPDLQRKIILRPLASDHSGFASVNPSFNPITGPWDVDNDGDGVMDSIWLDLGYPVQTATDGRQFKPLFAVLCLDLDGRLNVNAHGNLAQTDNATYTQSISGPFAGITSGDTSRNLRRGQGVGPADINLAALFPSATTSDEWYRKLLIGEAGEYPGRYGEFSLLGSGTPAPGVTNAEEPLSYFKQYCYPEPATPNRPSSFASPVDLWGRGAIAVDLHGTPMPLNMGLNGETVDDPYEINLSRKVVREFGVDAPFTAAELERILRPYDFDTSLLPGRLQYFLNAAKAGYRQTVTTDSYDLPVAATLPNRDLRSKITTGSVTAPSIVDLINIKAGTTLSPTALAKLLPAELLNGKRMDINRPFGNGRDDNGNNIVDEPGETDANGFKKFFVDVEAGINNVLPPSVYDSINFDVDNDGSLSSTSDLRARQLLAKHIYVLLMLSVKGDYDFDGDGTASPAETAYTMAQWAINAVDFRDRDSIMTPFEFDLYPFQDDAGNDGITWDVDDILDDGTGSVSTDDASMYNFQTGTGYRGLVWGCERPELLISEVIAFHDRRTEDLASPAGKTDDTGNTPKGETDQTATPPGANDFDQRLRPVGAFFVELYNPWRTYASTINGTDLPMSAEASGEFYNMNVSTGATSGVLLHQTSAGGHPVWRIAVAKGIDRNKDTDDPNESNATAANNSIERRIYFAQPPGAVTPGDYYCSAAPAPLQPGRYAVLGSSGPRNDGVTPIGRLDTFAGGNNNDPPDYSTTRRIVLNPSANPQVQVLTNTSTPPEPAAGDIKPPIAIPINRGVVDGTYVDRSLAISDPLNGYPTVDAGNGPIDTSTVVEGIYTQPYDQPLDDAQAANAGYEALKKFGTNWQFRTVLLQRLANPMLPWNAKNNPYLTIDSMSVDLTVFNGVTPNEASIQGGPGYQSIDVNLETHQRGSSPTNTGASNNLWSHDQDAPNPLPAPQPIANTNHIFDYSLLHTLGYLNKNYLPAFTAAAGTNPAPVPSGSDADWYRGEPSSGPFPWMNWQNRPYVSVFELLNVPKSRSSRLLFDWSVGPVVGGNGAYSAPVSGHGHLLNFFEKAGTTPHHLYRVFDFLEVPSPFVGTELVLDHKTFQTPMSGTAAAGTEFLHPPFNVISEMRDPGKVNINTIASADVWAGIMNGRSSPTWSQLIASRRGYPIISSNELTPNPDWPSVFANPFRNSSSGELTASLDAALPAVTPPRVEREDIDVTLMRPDDPATSSNTPLFGFTSADAYNNPDRNPYFRFQELSRISNLVTTRSNVYAIWVTMGYFEVEAAPTGYDPKVYPDGYKLKQELGADTGEITRHRAFYIYDRTIPVGYQRGQDLNIETGILLKRMIE